ncbi:482_t:CDS:2, partial [Diversispora eburnea]
MSVVIPATNRCAHECEHGWNDLTWVEFMKFIDILTIITYVKCADICDYWSIKQETAGVSLAFVLTFIWMNQYVNRWAKLIKARSNEKFQGNQILLDDQYPATVTSMLRLVEPWFRSGRTVIVDSWFDSTNAYISLYNYGLYSILQIKKRRYWSRNIPHDITGAREDTYRSSISQTCKINNVDLAVCSIRDQKNIILLSSYSTTTLGTEVNRYIKDSGDVKFCQPVVFDEYNEFRSAVDILNNLRNNALSYHDVFVSKCSVDRIFTFYLLVVEANSFSAYCQFVPGKKDMKYVNFYKQLVRLIFECYSDQTITDRAKKRRKKDTDNFEHHLINFNSDLTISKLKSKYVQHRCKGCSK